MVSKRKQPTGMLVNGTTSLIVSIHEPTLWQYPITLWHVEELYIYIYIKSIDYICTNLKLPLPSLNYGNPFRILFKLAPLKQRHFHRRFHYRCYYLCSFHICEHENKLINGWLYKYLIINLMLCLDKINFLTCLNLASIMLLTCQNKNV
jgi:hypothetical protein